MANIKYEKIDHKKNAIFFQEHTKNMPPRDLLLKTLKIFGDFTGSAIDLGCGSGFDTLKLIESGWEVFIVDANPIGFENIKSKIPKDKLSYAKFKQECFENISLPCADLVYSAFSIPFCRPKSFGRFWNNIVNAVNKNGRFAGHFFGEKDDWSYLNDMTFKSKKQIYQLFENFEIEYFNESLEVGMSILGSQRRYHIFEIIASKKV